MREREREREREILPAESHPSVKLSVILYKSFHALNNCSSSRFFRPCIKTHHVSSISGQKIANLEK
jgi:hypothetical protein